MKLIKYIMMTLITTFVFTGCIRWHNLDIVAEKNTKENFEVYVNNVEDKMIECYFLDYRETNPITRPYRYIVREDYYDPRYSKLKVFMDTGSKGFTSNIATVYLIKNGEDVNSILRVKYIVNSISNSYAEWFNKMECSK